MWQSLSIATKIILCLSILILGYFASMVYVFSNGKNVEHRLAYVSEVSFPAALNSQAAANAFKEQVRLYSDSVMLGEPEYLNKAKTVSYEILYLLESIKNLRNLPKHTRDQINTHIARLKDYTTKANAVYAIMTSAGKIDYQEIQKLATDGKNLEDHLFQLNQELEQTLTSDLALISRNMKDHATFNMIAFFVVMVSAVSIMWLIITRSIIKPLKQTVHVLKQISTGDLSVRLSAGKDEIGIMGQALNSVVLSLDRKVNAASQIARGNLDINVDVASDHDTLGIALNTMIRSLNTIASGILEAADMVDIGSRQVAESSQVLTKEAVDQASSLEQASAAISTIGFQTEKNAEHARQANQQTEDAFQAAVTGSKRMNEMVSAMEHISRSTNEIEKINKTIDDIAFQINLLSLNAAIEAARAGKHGKGFAVVAQEVRNLAMKSARAVQETSMLIEGAVLNVSHGNKIALKTSNAFSDIHCHISTAAELVNRISSSSTDQAYAINQVSEGLFQLVNSTQKNSAAAEQTSSTAIQLSTQASYVRNLIGRFRIKKSQTNKIPPSLPMDNDLL